MGTNFANVALTDTFDTWRVRTNQLVTDANDSTHENTANTVVRRGGLNETEIKVGQITADGTIFAQKGIGTGMSVSSSSDVTTPFDPTTGAMVINGGASIKKSLNVGANIYVQGTVEAKGDITLGTTGPDDDTLALNADISTNIEPEGTSAGTEVSIGTNEKRWKRGHFWRAVGANTSSYLMIPSGGNSDSPAIDEYSSGSDRDLHLRGAVRYNYDLSRFEGYNHTANTFVGLGGAVDADQDTFISLEESSGSDEDEIKFFTGNGGSPEHRWTIHNAVDGGHLAPAVHNTYEIGRPNNRVLALWANNTFTHGTIGRDATSSVTIPAGTNLQRPTADLTNGMLRFNTDLDNGKGALEYYSPATQLWYGMPASAASYNTRIQHPADGTTEVDATHNPNYTQIFLNGVKLDESDVVLTGEKVQFQDFTVGTDDIIDVMSITAADLSKAAIYKERFERGVGQTVFTTSNGYGVGMLVVYVNGVKIDSHSLTATDGVTFTIPSGTAGDIVESVGYTMFEETDIYTKQQWRNANTLTITANTYVNVDDQSHANASLAVDTTNERLGIGIYSPDTKLHIHGDVDEQVKISRAAGSTANVTLDLGTTGNFTVKPSGTTTTLDSQNVIVTGNLQVTGTQTTIDSTSIQAQDPFIILNNITSQPTVNTNDIGMLFKRGSAEVKADPNAGTGDAHMAMIWDESLNEFAFIETADDGNTFGDIVIDAYKNIHVGKLEAETASVFNSDLAITGMTTFNNYISSSILPDTQGYLNGAVVNNSRDLGDANKKWGRIFVGETNVGDINMQNEEGHFTLDEKAEFIRVYNHKNGKYYKIVMEEIE